MKQVKIIWVFVHILFGAYFLNFALGFIPLPEFVTNINSWIIFIGGILIILSAFNSLKSSKPKREKHSRV